MLVWLHSRPWRTTLAIGWINSKPLLLAATAPLQNMFIQQQRRLLFEGDDLGMTSLERFVTRPIFEHGQRQVQVACLPPQPCVMLELQL